MKKLFVTAFLGLSMNISAVGAEPNMVEMMKKFEQAGTPGAPHKVLADMAGSWKYVSKWWDSADGKPQQSSGRSTMKMILGGRWLQQDFKGESMGKPFQGMGLLGYDNVTGTYESLWFDTMSTGVAHATGSFDAQTKTIKDSGSHSCPLSPDKKQDFRSEWQIVDKNHMVYSMFGKGIAGDKEFKQMEISYTRGK